MNKNNDGFKENGGGGVDISHTAELVALRQSKMKKSSGIRIRDQSCDDAEGVDCQRRSLMSFKCGC